MKVSQKAQELQRSISQARQPNGYLVLDNGQARHLLDYISDLIVETKILEEGAERTQIPPDYEGENVHILHPHN